MFKVGDRVRVTNCWEKDVFPKGYVGTVASILQIDGSWWYMFTQVEAYTGPEVGDVVVTCDGELGIVTCLCDEYLCVDIGSVCDWVYAYSEIESLGSLE